MLIKESTLRRIIREEARLSLREAENAPLRTAGGPEDRWDGLVSSTTNFATKFATAAKGKGGSSALSSALKDLQVKGMTSKYAAMASAAPGTITGAPANNGAIGKLVCLLAGIVEMRAYTDYNSAQVVLTGISGGQDIVGPMILAALDGNGNAAASMIDNIKTLGSAMPPGYTKPAQAAQRSVSVSTNLRAVANGTEVLKRGSKNVEAVKDLQTLINAIMPGAVVVDGVYGDKTVSAIVGYQKAHGIQVDGQCGRETLSSMFGQKASISGGAPAGGAYLGPDAIIGNKPTQSLPESRRRRY
jgi:hypothetical protein